jgi:hypothetical protein
MLSQLNPPDEQSPQYIGEYRLVTWIGNDPKIYGMPVLEQPFESQLTLLEDSLLEDSRFIFFFL